MSRYEKIASLLIGILVVVMVVFSFLEVTETEEEDSDFDRSFGESFIMGPFTTIISEDASPEKEQNCEVEEIVIASVLHDISDELVERGEIISQKFEVDDHTLDLLCHKTAKIILSNDDEQQLILVKKPFTRAIPEGASAEDVGSEVWIDATIVPAGEETPVEPTVSGYALLPDRYLDIISQ